MSTTRTSFSSYFLLKNLRLGTRNDTFSSFSGGSRLPMISTKKKDSRRQVDISIIGGQGRAYRSIRMNLNAANNIPSGGPPSPGWSSWMLLAIIPMILTIFSGKWGTLSLFKKKVDSILESAAIVAETIEDVAEGVDKIADEVSENLPEGSRARGIIEKIDHVAEQIVKGADVVEEILQEVENVEDMMETTIKDVGKQWVGVNTSKEVEEK